MAADALPSHLRPFDRREIHTHELPATPFRDRTIAAGAWVEAPPELGALGAEIGGIEAGYLRRINGWLLWRAGPATHADARYLAIDVDDLGRQFRFDLAPDGAGVGRGPSGATHHRFRTWKEDLRDHP